MNPTPPTSLEERVAKLESSVRTWKIATFVLAFILFVAPTPLGQITVGISFVILFSLGIAAAVFALLYVVIWLCDVVSGTTKAVPEPSSSNVVTQTPDVSAT